MRFWRKRQHRSKKRTCHLRRLRLEEFEPRRLSSASNGTWTELTNLAPAGVRTMLLLSNGTVMAQENSVTNVWYQLTPDASGNYINGTWSPLAPMSLQRNDFGSAVLPNGNVFVLGGEESGPSGAKNWTNTGEIYNPVSNSWTSITPFPEPKAGDVPTEVLPDGTVGAGYINGTATFAYSPATNSWSPVVHKLYGDTSSEETWLSSREMAPMAAEASSRMTSIRAFRQEIRLPRCSSPLKRVGARRRRARGPLEQECRKRNRTGDLVA